MAESGGAVRFVISDMYDVVLRVSNSTVILQADVEHLKVCCDCEMESFRNCLNILALSVADVRAQPRGTGITLVPHRHFIVTTTERHSCKPFLSIRSYCGSLHGGTCHGGVSN